MCSVLLVSLLTSCSSQPKYEKIPDFSTTERETPTQSTTNQPESSVSAEPMASSIGDKKSHSYGVAKNGKPNDISVNAQKYFEQNNLNAFCLDTKSKNKILYLTFDCGYENGYTSKILDVLKEKM